MEQLPVDDPAMMQSYINTLLRDYYPSLEAMCEDRGYDLKEVERQLAAAGLEYNRDLNKVW